MSVPAAPVLRPTYEEWHDFAAYVRQITPLIERFGGCQVIPPPEWKHQSVPPLSTGLETKTKITPIRQHVHGKNGKFQSVMEWSRPAAADNFIADAVAADATIAGLEPEDLDAKFWRFVAAPPASLYGSDSSEAGSLFDPELKEWNLGALPGGVDHDLTQSLPMAIPGLNRSMLYFAAGAPSCAAYGGLRLGRVVPPLGRAKALVRRAALPHAERVRSLAATSFPGAQVGMQQLCAAQDDPPLAAGPQGVQHTVLLGPPGGEYVCDRPPPPPSTSVTISVPTVQRRSTLA